MLVYYQFLANMITEGERTVKTLVLSTRRAFKSGKLESGEEGVSGASLKIVLKGAGLMLSKAVK
jgi:hypothetical protein